MEGLNAYGAWCWGGSAAADNAFGGGFVEEMEIMTAHFRTCTSGQALLELGVGFRNH